MCGIVGYVGPQQGLQVVLEGLRRLEYRGYDSAGVAVVNGGLSMEKRAGKLAMLEKALVEAGDDVLPGTTAIGHTRWATHGPPNDVNAHPHLSCDGALAVIHNGIIENFGRLRDELEADGHEFRSETDSETAAHLLERAWSTCDGDLVQAMRLVCRQLEGAFTLLAVHRDEPDLVVGARRDSPLVVGIGDGENFLGSDVAAFIGHTREALELGQDQVVEVRPEGVTVTGFDGAPATTKRYHVDWDVSAAEKGGFPYFMLKEIYEQPRALADTLRGRVTEQGEIVLDELRMTDDEMRDVDKVFIVACGTAYHAGLVAKYAIEHWARIPCEVELASEFRYRDPVLDRSTLVIAISQSGETMDTLMAVRHAREQRARVVAVCNTNGSTIPRESDAVLYTRAGPEVGVAATKTFLTQVAACLLLGLELARVRGTLWGDEVLAVVRDLMRVPDLLQRTLDDVVEPVRQLAQEVAQAKAVLFLGRHVGYPLALEGALKLKELAYMHAEGFAAGELKHGPIALLEPGIPVVTVVPGRGGRSLLHDKIVSNLQEVRARGARNVVLAEEGDEDVQAHADLVIRIPRVPTLLQPLVATVPLQVLACEIALARGLDVDQPRNLAKSVTVE